MTPEVTYESIKASIKKLSVEEPYIALALYELTQEVEKTTDKLKFVKKILEQIYIDDGSMFGILAEEGLRKLEEK